MSKKQQHNRAITTGDKGLHSRKRKKNKCGYGGVPSLNFGKYKGNPLHKVPKDYLRWILDNVEIDNRLRSAIECVLCN